MADKRAPKLLVLDVDNTLFDWLPYYAGSNSAVLETLAKLIAVPEERLVQEFRQVMANFEDKQSFVLPQLPSMAGRKNDEENTSIYRTCAEVFIKQATSYLVPYPGVVSTLATIKQYRPHIGIIALTDSPTLEAIWKIDELGLAPYFDGIYGLDHPPVIPTGQTLAAIVAAQRRYRGVLKFMPSDHAKPSTKGLKMIIDDYRLSTSDKDQIVYAGDNFKKDIRLGKDAGVLTCWSEFGMPSDSPYLRQAIALSPTIKVKQNVPAHCDLKVRPDVTLRKFSDLLDCMF